MLDEAMGQASGSPEVGGEDVGIKEEAHGNEREKLTHLRAM
jgi:hypothetical protein